MGINSDLDSDDARHAIGLPPLLFTFTVDQIASMLSVDEKRVRTHYLFYQGRSVGRQDPRQMKAVNISLHDKLPEWRIAQREFVRYCRKVGFSGHDLSRAITGR